MSSTSSEQQGDGPPACIGQYATPGTDIGLCGSRCEYRHACYDLRHGLADSCHPRDPKVMELAGVTPAQATAVGRGYDFPCRTADEALGNLLAVIHRDGGHHQQERGIEGATRDAAELVVDCRQEIERCREALRQIADRCQQHLSESPTVAVEYLAEDINQILKEVR